MHSSNLNEEQKLEGLSKIEYKSSREGSFIKHPKLGYCLIQQLSNSPDFLNSYKEAALAGKLPYKKYLGQDFDINQNQWNDFWDKYKESNPKSDEYTYISLDTGNRGSILLSPDNALSDDGVEFKPERFDGYYNDCKVNVAKLFDYLTDTRTYLIKNRESDATQSSILLSMCESSSDDETSDLSEVAFKKVIRKGKVVRKKVKKIHRLISAARRRALYKARKKAHKPLANKHRLKSMKKRKYTGLNNEAAVFKTVKKR